MATILFCDNNLRNLLNFRGDVINSYLSDGYRVILVAPSKGGWQPENSGLRWIPIKFSRSSMNPFKDAWYLCKLIMIYHRERPDYVFHYTIKPNIYGSLAAKVCGIPSTAMIAGLGYVFEHKGLGSVIARWLYRFALQFSHKVLVLNSYNRDLVIEKHIAKPSQVILLSGGEGINLDKFKIDMRHEKISDDSKNSL